MVSEKDNDKKCCNQLSASIDFRIEEDNKKTRNAFKI